LSGAAESPATQPATTRRGLVVIALLLAMATAAIEALIVATAMPTIVGALGGLEQYGWVFSSYLLAQTASIPLYGRLADLIGRKPVFVGGSVLFLVGSLLCGLSGSMPMLIASRALQGLGAGAVIPVTSTIAGDLFPMEQRAKIQGYISAVWGVSSLVGPALGGLIVDHMGWPWIFYLNLPLGLVALALVAVFLHEEVEAKRPKLDHAGGALLVAGTVSILLLALEGGRSIPWNGALAVGLGSAALGATVLFLLQERRARDPVLPLSLFSDRFFAVVALVSVALGGLTLGVSSTVPPFVQGVLGTSATVAGLVLGAMSIGWPIAAVASGKLLVRFGFRFTASLGGLLTVASGALLLLRPDGAGVYWFATATCIMGAGLGLGSTASIVSVQQKVGWSQRGVATGVVMFLRQLGSTFGVAVLGGVVARRLVATRAETGLDPEALLQAATREPLPPETVVRLSDLLAEAFEPAFVGVLAMAVAGLVVLVALRRRDEPVAR